MGRRGREEEWGGEEVEGERERGIVGRRGGGGREGERGGGGREGGE